MNRIDTDIAEGLCECGCGERAPISDRTDARRGAIRGRPLRFVIGHSRRGRRRKRYEPQDCGYKTACWVWQLAHHPTLGYGFERDADGRTRYAHRMVYEALFGPIPDGMQLDHLCRNRACVNPEHLEPVSNAENTRRGLVAKLSHDDVAEIRASELPQAALAERYGVHSAHISRIRSGQRWSAR